MIMRLFSIFIILSFILFSACRSTRPIQAAISKIDSAGGNPGGSVHTMREDSMAFIREIYSDIRRNHIHFTTFAAKVDVDYEDAEGRNYDVNAHVRMYRDSVIWITITGALGIEGLRALITRDSVKLLDKQNKTYVARSVSFLQELTALPLNLPTLQDLLVGNPVYFDSTIVSYSRTEASISLQAYGNFFKHLLTVSRENRILQSSKLDDFDEMRNRTCYLTYEEYEDRKGVSFSTRRRIHVAEKKKLDIRLDYKQYDFNEMLTFPFNIPKNYERN
jgi:hypothetical protein